MATKNASKTNQQTKKLGVTARVNWLNPDAENAVRAAVSINIGDAFAVHGLKVCHNAKGDFVSMPSYKSKDEYKNVFHAITAEARQEVIDAVMSACEQKLSEQGESFGDCGIVQSMQ